MMKKMFIALTALSVAAFGSVAYAETTEGIDSTVIYDANDILITVVSAEVNEYDEYQLNLEVENNSDKTIRVDFDDPAINGWYCDPYWGTEITAGDKYVGAASWYSRDMQSIGIDDPDQITIITSELDILDYDTWDEIDHTTFTLYPKGEEAAAITERESEDTDVVLVDTEDYTITAIGFDPETEWKQKELLVYINNKSEAHLLIAIDDVSVNDIMCDPGWGITMPGNAQAYGRIDWVGATVEEKGISDFEKIDFTLRLYDDDTYDVLLEEAINVTVADLKLLD